MPQNVKVVDAPTGGASASGRKRLPGYVNLGVAR